jgi:NO-binding membrane sensor protein with MHYT domain
MITGAITMGGVAIWCMHFLANRAITLGNGEIEIQIQYSPGFTALSFFYAVILLILAFFVAGPSDKIAWDRLVLGGAVAALGITGMHFLAQAGILNYDCFYDVPYVIGAALFGIVLSTVALGMCLMLLSRWQTTWWKTAVCAFIWSCAATGMHWLASISTRYRFKQDFDNPTTIASRNATTLLGLILVSASSIAVLLRLAYAYSQSSAASVLSY